jgi:hypothetical protein
MTTSSSSSFECSAIDLSSGLKVEVEAAGFVGELRDISLREDAAHLEGDLNVVAM